MLFDYTEKEFEEARKNDPKYYFGLTLVSTDKTGTKHYKAAHKCWKCGGSGEYLDFGTCFACKGSGFNYCKIRIFTDEHKKKLNEEAIKRHNKKMQNRKNNSENLNKEYFDKNGFNSKGKAWALIQTGFVPKELDEELISKGAKRFWNWHVYLFKEPQSNYDCIELNASDLCIQDLSGVYVDFDYTVLQKLLDDKKESERKAIAEKSDYFGNIGDKVKDLELTYLRNIHYETQFGWMSIYLFEDSAGNQFKWNTSSGFSHVLDEGEKIKINGTIKAHSLYNGIKQTVLTRCKLVV